MTQHVTITSEGRSGSVIYTSEHGRISGWWEFGGGNVITIANMGSMQEWAQQHPWAVQQRGAVLHFVAQEMIRQKAPSCTARIDEASGWIELTTASDDATEEQVDRSTPTAGHAARVTASEGKGATDGPATWYQRHRRLRARLGFAVAALAGIAVAVGWFRNTVLTVEPAKGVPHGDVVRTDKHIAAMILSTDPHLPEISGRGGNTTNSMSILLIPLAGGSPDVVRVKEDLPFNAYALSRIMGSDGHTLWADCAGLVGVRLKDRSVVTPADLQRANPDIDHAWWEDQRGIDIVDGRLHVINADRSAALDVDPVSHRARPVAPRPSPARHARGKVEALLASGTVTSASDWLGVYAADEVLQDLKVGGWVRRVESAQDARRDRQLYRALLEQGPDSAHFRVRSREAIGEASFMNAAFLRISDTAEPVRIPDPESVLMLFTENTAAGGTLAVARVGVDGSILWRTDTGLDRFGLQQVLPGTDACAYVGAVPPVEGKLSEPLVVLVDNATGQRTVHTLWR